MMMKKKIGQSVTGVAALLVFFFIIHLHFSSLDFSLSYQENKPLTVKEISKLDPLESHQLQPFRSSVRLSTVISCDRAQKSYDVCEINGPATLDPAKATFYATGPTRVEKIRPYPRKLENSTMSRIKELTLVSGPLSPTCQVQHRWPALVFSAGGYTGNFFHDFSDGFIPLYITVNSLFDQDQRRDLVLVVHKSRDWWVHKYSELLRGFTRHPIVNLDNDTSTHCFPSVKLGLVSHGLMVINPDRTVSVSRFRAFLGQSYGRRIASGPARDRPRLVLMSRSGAVGRVIVNEREVRREAERVGFEVVVLEPTSKTELSKAYELVNSSHAMVGVHGAALTHALFLRPGSTLIQVVPLGVEWLAEVCFGGPAREMGLDYVEYKVEGRESSLVEKYGPEEAVIKDPVGFRGKDWSKMAVYLKEQDVQIDLARFTIYLKKAYRNSKMFMDREG